MTKEKNDSQENGDQMQCAVGENGWAIKLARLFMDLLIVICLGMASWGLSGVYSNALSIAKLEERNVTTNLRVDQIAATQQNKLQDLGKILEAMSDIKTRIAAIPIVATPPDWLVRRLDKLEEAMQRVEDKMNHHIEISK